MTNVFYIYGKLRNLLHEFGNKINQINIRLITGILVKMNIP